ncbi:MAG: hypothetical protein ACFFB3_22265 [Candidatus Hodarchaeota archaeon]
MHNHYQSSDPFEEKESEAGQEKTKGTETCAGRILVVGSQGGGKTALATRLAALTDPKATYEESLGGTIETEYFRFSSLKRPDLFALLLPVGGQEKWSALRTAYGETAEGIITVLDSCTKAFWETSLRQALALAPALPYDDFPIGFAVTKRDLNEMLSDETGHISEAIMSGIENARVAGADYYSRSGAGKVIRRHVDPSLLRNAIPFSVAEQLIVNALERTYFEDLEPGDARKGKQKLKGLSLVNARLFARALASALSLSEDAGEGTRRDQQAVLALLNDMRPTLLELDSSWETLQHKYPTAGPEPQISLDLGSSQIDYAIYSKLLANQNDINEFLGRAADLSPQTGWRVHGESWAGVFEERGLNDMAKLVQGVMAAIEQNRPNRKFALLDPIESMF